MLDLKAPSQSLTANWNLLSGLLQTYGPEGFHAERMRALDAFDKVGIPTTRVEEFKYLSLKPLEEVVWAPAYGAVIDRHERAKLPLGDLDAITVTFVNGEYAPELSSAHSLPANCFVGPLKDVWENNPEVVEPYLTKIATLDGMLGTTNDERFVSLNTAYLSEGAMVYVPKNTAMEHPIHLQFITQASHGPMVTYPRVLIVVEPGSEAKVVESYIGTQGVYFTNAVSEVWLADDSILEHSKVQLEMPNSIHIANISVHQEGSSTYTSNNINLGGQIVRNDVNVYLDGEHTETWLNGVAVGLENQVLDNHTRIDHAKPNCHSFEVYKSVLGGRAQGVFNGKIFVYVDAQKTDAKQSNQALLLSAKAGMNTKPQLEIFADDVKCTHGATIGQLRDDAMFYLRARGIPKKQARALLVYAFAAEAIDKISIVSVREELEKLLYDRLHETEDLPEAE